MITNSTLIDNSSEALQMASVVGDLMLNEQCKTVKIATGYWDIPGTALLLQQLTAFLSRENTIVQILIGKDPVVRASQQKNPKYKGAQKQQDFIRCDLQDLEVKDEYVDTVSLLKKYCLTDFDNSRIQIKMCKADAEGNTQFFHAKSYIFLGDDFAKGIIGSSNFTQKGLEGNSELNYLEWDNTKVTAEPNENSKAKGHKYWFDEKWSQAEEWNKTFLEEVLHGTSVEKKAKEKMQAEIETPLTPYEVYIKYLQLQFGDMVDANTSEVLKSYLPQNFNSLEYQLDAVKQCFSVMRRFGGFILGDVVGLGKTVVGLLLIRHFLENAESLGRARKVLIVTPPAIKKNWIKTIHDFDQNHKNQIEPCVTFVTTGSVETLTEDMQEIEDDGGDEIENLNVDNFGLIVIDESHNFRNSSTQKYNAINDLIGIINPTPYVALLSATPQNNSPKDIYNQIRLFQRNPNNSTLPGVEGGKLDTFFNNMERRFKEARRIPQDTEENKLAARAIIAEVSEQVRRCVLNDLVVRRTRTDIKKMYGDDAELLKFPTVKGPHKLEYQMDEELKQLFHDTVVAICPQGPREPFDPNKHIGFFRYTAIAEFKDDDNKQLYEKRNLTVGGITRRLKRIMQMLLVKRLESSMTAFKITLDNLFHYNDVMIEMLQHDCVYICPDIDVNKIYAESNGNFTKFKSDMDALIAKKGDNNRRFSSSDFNDSYLNDLLNDKRLIKNLLNRWYKNSYDPKFDRFKEAIDTELFNPEINNPSGFDKPRLVIFTEAKDTLDSIVRVLKAKHHKVLDITSDNRAKKQEKIDENFDANYPIDKQRDDYDVIVTTEVLAEGVNLHRANVILNYDAPWNATRLMQRIGRVNRIGSKEDFVHVFNFFPSEDGNEQIRLIEKAYAKLQSFHEMFGEDNKVFSEREELCEHDLQRMVDGEESPFGPFINELKAYRDNNSERYSYIASINPNTIGGTITLAEKADSLFIFTDNSQGYITVKVNTAEENAKTQIISSLATMERLKCSSDVQFTSTKLGDNALADIALKAYQKHVAHYLTQSDSSKQVSKALDVISNIRHNSALNMESKKILKQIEHLVRSKDNYIIKLVLKYDTQQLSLFGAGDDINAILQASFANTASRATVKRGEPRLTLFEIK